MLKRSLGVLFFCTILLLNNCARHGSYGSGFYKGNNARWHAGFYTVRRGDTLYSVAWQYGYDSREIARWNGIKTPYTIYPGQKLRLIPPNTKSTTTTTSKANASSIKSSNPHTKRKQSASGDTSKKKSASHYSKIATKNTSDSKNLRWRWPTRGKLLTTFSLSSPGRKGVNIAGRSGQAIVAAAAGKVVYSGQGLRGYGNLIIIQHNEAYFSAYAHNQKIHVKEKQKVKIGQRIADMGSTDAEKNMLHFEIRRNGIPVDPLKYLPK